jgi:hypothetical protein
LWQYFSRLLAGAVMAIAHPSGRHLRGWPVVVVARAVPPLWQLLRVVWTMTVDDRPNRAAVAEFRLVSSTSVKWSSAASSLAFTLCPIFSITARSPCGVRNAISLQIARLRMWTELCTPHGLRLFDGDCVRSPGAEYTQFCPHETFASGLFDHCRVLER